MIGSTMCWLMNIRTLIALQAKILPRLKPDGQGVMVVGDDAQSIYSFRAATIRNILEFPNQFAPPAKVITLEKNYRSTQPILEACNRSHRARQGSVHKESIL